MQKENQLKSCCKKIMSFHDAPLPSSRSVSMRDIRDAKDASLYPAFARAASTGMTSEAGGFTLIELLVVVLIIGILAAVAVPQYQKAVEKSRTTQALTLLKSVYNSVKAYQLANGEWPSSFDELAVDIPWTGNTKGLVIDGPAKSNSDWSLQLRHLGNNDMSVFITRLAGPYKGGQFWIIEKTTVPSLVPTNTVLCAEQLVGPYQIPTEGMFCKKLFSGTKLAEGDTNRIYSIKP